MKDLYALKTPVPEQILTSSLHHYITYIPMHVTVDDVNFYDGLECIYVKYKSCASIVCELPD